MKSLFAVALMTLFLSCNDRNVARDDFNQQEVLDEVTKAVWAFHHADTSKNASAVIDLLWPEYSMLGDGHRISYEEVVSGSKQFMSGLSLFHTKWTDLQIIPISESSALSSFIFRDSIITKSGQLTKSRGPNTFLWEKRNGKWKVLYGDADHYPIK